VLLNREVVSRIPEPRVYLVRDAAGNYVSSSSSGGSYSEVVRESDGQIRLVRRGSSWERS